jgi:hypothetical protein
MLRPQPQRNDRKRIQFAAGLQVLILLKAPQRVGRILIPNTVGLAVQITLLGQRFLNFLVTVGGGRRLSRVPCRARRSFLRRARRSLLRSVRRSFLHRTRRGLVAGAPRGPSWRSLVRASWRSLVRGRLVRRSLRRHGFFRRGSGRRQPSKAGQSGRHYRNGFSQMQSFSGYG